MSENVDLDAKSRLSAGAPLATNQPSPRGELPERPEPRVVPTTPEWPEWPGWPESPEQPEPPKSPGSPVSVGHRDEKALATIASLIGALVLARAVNDPKLSDDILRATKKQLDG